jgi:uncharacterized protein
MRIQLKVFPKSSREEIVEKDGITKAYVKAAPEKGKANKALIALVAGKYKVRKKDVAIITGQTGKNKTLEVSGI